MSYSKNDLMFYSNHPIGADGNRQTGRTTLLLSAANRALLRGGTVLVLAQNERDALRMCRESGKAGLRLTPKHIQPFTQESKGVRVDELFIDHWVVECRLRSALLQIDDLKRQLAIAEGWTDIYV